MKRVAESIVLVLLGSALAGCGPATGPDEGSQSAIPPSGSRIFYVKGVVRELSPEGNSVRIRHEEIPGYMEAMTMPFQVRDEQELAGLEPGQAVLFRLVVTEDDSWIDEVTRLPDAVPEPSPPETTRRVRWVEPLAEGELLPPYPLTNQWGEAFGLTDFKGQVLAFTFIYTRCPLPNFCPRMTSHFLEAQRELLGRPDAPERWRLLTVSFDPEHDTPAVLRAYATQHGCDPERWMFATGAREELDALMEQFGLSYGRLGETFDHNLRTVVVDPDGRIRRILVGNEWQPAELVREMVAAGGPTSPTEE
ncbi:MAG: SCO family protein [Verrucomicrobia bacterium]|nr:SCO family protein [Verrucomicrobiota bacterium]